jgi:hypothetical protein
MFQLSALLDPVTITGVQPTRVITHDLLDGHSYITDHHRFCCCKCCSTCIYFIELVVRISILSRVMEYTNSGYGDGIEKGTQLEQKGFVIFQKGFVIFQKGFEFSRKNL